MSPPTDRPSFPLLPLTHGGELARAGVAIGDGYALLTQICDRFPNRAAGFAGERGVGVFVADALRAAGLVDVVRDQVPCFSTDFARTELRVGDAKGQALEAVPMSFSGSTPPGGVTAPLLYVDDEADVDWSDATLRGKVLLVFGGFGEYTTTEHYAAACQAGLAGVVVIRDAEFAVSFGLPLTAAACGNVPVLNLAYASGMALLKSGATTAFLDVRTGLAHATGHNVIARLPANASRLDDTGFLVSAHLDAQPVRPAAADNATGTAMAVEVMRTLARTPTRRRDVWFAGYTDEEFGFSGARHFRTAHADLVRRCHAQFYYDGHGNIVGRNELVITGDDALAAFMESVAAAIGHRHRTARRTNTLDPHVLFADGVPAVQVGRNPQRTWHTQHDVVADVAPAAMRAGIHLYAEALYRLVNAPFLPFARTVPDDARRYGEERLAAAAATDAALRRAFPEPAT